MDGINLLVYHLSGNCPGEWGGLRRALVRIPFGDSLTGIRGALDVFPHVIAKAKGYIRGENGED